ncbi:MAG TPA: DUF2892 domain-containing protein [Polyangiaceae bacterium]|nr:DUF2892 domain-containing protein [Polyangiaceae bacterium]
MTTLKYAFFAKNLPVWERVLRSVAAAAALAGGWAMGTPYRELGVAAAATLLVTGLFGFCPACAMVGRKLPAAPGER